MSIERRYALLQHVHTLNDLTDWPGYSVTGDHWGKVAYVGSDGVMEIGKYIDFHETDGAITDFAYRLQSVGGILAGSGSANFNGSVTSTSIYTQTNEPSWWMDETDAAVDNKIWRRVASSGILYEQVWNDAINSGNTWLTVNRSGITPTNVNLYARTNLYGYDTWSGSGWARCLSLRPAVGSCAIQFWDQGLTRHWGVGATGGTFYLMFTANDSSGGAGMSYPFYIDATYLTVDYQARFTNHVALSSGYVIWLNGWGSNEYLGNNTAGTYTPLRIAGTKGGYSGIHLPNGGSVSIMYDASGNGGPYRESASSWQFYHNEANDCTSFGGTTSSASYRIYVTGSSFASGTWATSDERKKREIRNIPSALDRVCAMRGVEFKWRPDANVGQDPDKVHLGVIAQEIHNVIPEVVNYAADVDTFAVDYNGLVGLLIEAIKELRDKHEQANRAGKAAATDGLRPDA